MFDFLKDKLKKAVETFSKKVNEETKIVEPTKEQKEEIIEELKKEKEIKEIKEQVLENIEEKIEEGAKEIQDLQQQEQHIQKKQEEVKEEKKGFFARLKDKLLHKKDTKEPKQEVAKEEFEIVGKEVEEFEKAFEEAEKDVLGKEERPITEDEKEELKEELIPVVTEEDKETRFELREKPTITIKKKEKQAPRKPKEPEHTKETTDHEIELEKTGILEAVKDIIFKTSLSEEQFEDFFWDIEVGLLENNVAVEVIDLIKTNLKKDLVQKKLLRGKIEEIISNSLKNSVKETFSVPTIDVLAKIKEKKKKKEPFVIVFVGINGSGKTTTIAKIAQKLKDNKVTCVIAAGDTFRAAAIQQLEEHANKLKVKMIKHNYGADPAAVGFDAIKYAKAHNIDCVLIDTAGRLHSNTNLMAEMKKIIRVTNPDLKLFIGEAITGNDCVEQARQFNDAIGIDGIILAKADVDDKGGAALSISYVTQKPILFLGTGQTYGDLEEFDKEKIIERLGLGV